MIGFMKDTHSKGAISAYTENEILYLKSILKNKAEKWEDMSTLTDVFRHCKFTIRMLSR